MNKEKILTALVAISGQYNLPKEQLQKIVDLAPADLTEDTLDAWVQSQKGYMALMQSYSDNRVTAQRTELDSLRNEFEQYKKDHGQQTGGNADLEKALGTMKEQLEASFNEKLKGYSELQTKFEELQKKNTDNEKAEKERQFTELKKRVASELGLNDKALGLLEGKLTIDMDETKVNEVLTAGKKDLQDLGIHSVEGGPISKSSSEAAEARAKAYLDRLEAQQKNAQ